MKIVDRVLVALAVNSFRVPTRKRQDKLFFLELNHLAYDRYSRNIKYKIGENDT